MMSPASDFALRMRQGLLHRLGRSPSRFTRQTGFTLIEVLVAIAITMIFISITLQIMVTAALFRSNADQYNQAFNWIQKDYETVFNKAIEYENSVSPYSSKCLAPSSASGLAASFINDATTGLGGSPVSIGSITFNGKSFVMTRTADYASSDDPYRLVRLTYTVTPVTGGPAVLSIDVETVLYAGFKCPT